MTYYDNAFETPRGLIERSQNDRQSLMRKETEDFFRILHEHSPTGRLPTGIVTTRPKRRSCSRWTAIAAAGWKRWVITANAWMT